MVWVGFDDNRAAGLSGSGQALQVWAGLVSRLPVPDTAPAVPAGVEWHWAGFDGESFRTDPGCPGAVRLPFRGTARLEHRPC